MKIEEVLQECLTVIEEGRARAEECVARYPQLRQELEPLLVMAAQLRSTSHPVLSEPRRLAMRGRVISLPLPQPTSMPRLILRPVMALATLFLAFLFSGAVLAVASDGSLPGDPLYPVKRILEDFNLAIVSAGEPQADLRLFIAERRLDEAVALVEKGQIESAESVLREYRQQLEAVEWLIAGEIARTGQIPDVASRLQEQLAQQEAQLTQMHDLIAQEYLAPIDEALTTIQEFQGITKKVLEGTSPPFPTPQIPFFEITHPSLPEATPLAPIPELPQPTPLPLPTISLSTTPQPIPNPIPAGG